MELVELRRVCHVEFGTLARTKLENKSALKEKHTQTSTEECDVCVGDRKLSPLMGLPHCSPITLRLFQDRVCVSDSAPIAGFYFKPTPDLSY